ncbi:MAG: hypothetical protein ABMA25_06040 [Ilumatobacteraceae bacterium]
MTLAFAAFLVLVVAAAVPIWVSTKRWRLLSWAAALSWLGVLLIGLAWGALILLLGDTYCDGGLSNYGELSWSWLPPGPVCTWTAQSNGAVGRAGPTWVMSTWLIVLLVWGFAVRYARRKARDERKAAAGT